jgi:hypothetical protein
MIGVRLPSPAFRFLGCLSVIALALTLAGCGGGSTEELTCPAAAVAPDLDAVAIFPPGSDSDPANLQAAGKIFAITRQCESEKGGILINAVITINAVRQTPQVQRVEYVYFVAVIDSDRKILNEQRFTLAALFGSSDIRQYNEKISVHLPLDHVSSGDGYTVVTGFQLTPDQLDFNRTHRSQ